MRFFLLGVLCVFSMSARAAELRSAKALTTQLKGQVFTGQLKPGFHFNEKAPNTLIVDGTGNKPRLLERQKIEFRLPKKSWTQAQASLFVCDDANTYCETHDVDLATANMKKSTAAQSKNATSRETPFQKMLGRAKKESKPVFLSFSARWCPGCLRYENEVFPSSEFKRINRDIFFLKVDVDLFENMALSRRYQLQGVPSIVAVDGDGNEIDRLVDFRPTEELIAFIRGVQSDPVSLARLKQLAEQNKNDSAIQLRFGKKLLSAGQYGESAKILGAIEPVPTELWSARVGEASEAFKKDEKSKEAYKKQLQEAIAAAPEDFRALMWRTDLLGLLEPGSRESKKILEQGQATIAELMNNPAKLKAAFAVEGAGEFLGFEKMLIAEMDVQMSEAAKTGEEQIQAAWDRAVAAASSYQITPNQSGPALRYLIYLSAAKKFEAANQWAEKLLKHKPGNLDVLRRRMRIYLGLNKPTEAAAIGEKIIASSEGRNQFWVAESLAKAYIALERKLDARKLLQAYLARPEIQTESMKSIKKSMEELLAGLGS